MAETLFFVVFFCGGGGGGGGGGEGEVCYFFNLWEQIGACLMILSLVV